MDEIRWPEGPWVLDLKNCPQGFNEQSLYKYRSQGCDDATKPNKLGYIINKNSRVRNIELHYPRYDYEKVVVRAKILASMRKKVYTCHVTVNDVGDVIEGHCTCIGGITGQCKHTFALLWSILDYILQEKSQINNEEVPCTSAPKTWGLGSKTATADSKKPFSELKFVKHDPSKPVKNTLINIHKRLHKTQKHLDVKITHSILKNHSEMLSDGGLFMFADILKENEFEPVPTKDCLPASPDPHIDVIIDPKPSSSHHKLKKTNNIMRVADKSPGPNVNDIDNPINLPLETKWDIELANFIRVHRLDDDKLSHCSVSIEGARELEKSTRTQSECALWFLEKKKRISSSNFASIIRRKKAVTQTFHEKIWPHTRNHIQSAFMKLGLNNEEAATMKYLALNPQYTSFRCGLCVNPGIPFLCISPDRLIHDNLSNTCHLLEIKTLAKGGLMEKLGIKECIDRGYASFLKCTNDNNFSLKENHSHYYQIQGQLALSGLPFCDLLVDSGDEIFIQRIPFDEVDWVENSLPALASFHFVYSGQHVRTNP